MVSIRPGDIVETEFGTMVDAIYHWYAEHGAACGEVVIAFVADPPEKESLVAYFLSLIENEDPLRPLFIQLGQIEVYFISRDGQKRQHCMFKFRGAADTPPTTGP